MGKSLSFRLSLKCRWQWYDHQPRRVVKHCKNINLKISTSLKDKTWPCVFPSSLNYLIVWGEEIRYLVAKKELKSPWLAFLPCPPHLHPTWLSSAPLKESFFVQYLLSLLHIDLMYSCGGLGGGNCIPYLVQIHLFLLITFRSLSQWRDKRWAPRRSVLGGYDQWGGKSWAWDLAVLRFNFLFLKEGFVLSAFKDYGESICTKYPAQKLTISGCWIPSPTILLHQRCSEECEIALG